ncbi:MAG: hypothetical protein ABI597_12380, partial [Gammaproteobacteria bacterium]
QDKVDYINIHAADYNCTTLPHFHCPANLNNLFIDCNNTQTLINQANNNTSYSWSPTLVGGAIGCGFGALVGFGVGVATACSRMRSSASSLTESEIPTTTSDRSSTSAIDTATKDDIKLLAQGRSNSPVFSGRNIENDDSYHKLPESESEHTVALTV